MNRRSRLWMVFLILVSFMVASACIASASSVPEVEWIKNFEGHFYSVYETEDGSYLIGGKKWADYGWYGWVVKVDSSGNKVWDKTFEKWVTIYSVQQASDGGYIVAGDKGRTLPDAWGWKLDSSGTEEWVVSFGSDYDTSVSTT